MMTYEEKQKRLNSIRPLKRAMWEKWLDNSGWKLDAFLTWFNPPQKSTTCKSVESRIEKLRAENGEAYELYKELEKAAEKLEAMPCKGSYVSEIDGEVRTYILAGHLPNWAETSEDEDEALKMLAEYYAAQEAQKKSA